MTPFLYTPLVKVPVAVALSAVLLAGCASFTTNGGMTLVGERTGRAIGVSATKIVTEADETAVRAQVGAMLKRSLDVDSAVRIALLNNRGLQAEYNALGISEADYVEASTLSNPVLSIGKLVTGGSLEIETRLAMSVLELFTLDSRRKVAGLEFEAAKLEAVEATFRLAAETRRAFYNAVAARQTVAFLEKGRESARLASELTIKLGETGASTKLEQARASAIYLEVSNQLAEARLTAEVEREALTRLLGLWGTEANYSLPGALPAIPDNLPKSEAVEASAITQRVDLMIAKLQLDALAGSLDLASATRYTSMLDLAGLANYAREKEDDEVSEERPTGFEVELEIPLFDTGEAEVRRGSEAYMQAVNRLAELAVNIRSEVRAAYVTYRAKYDISWQYRNRILPMREVISEQALLEYNGMLTDVFELLTTNSESIDSNIAAIAAKRDFFLAAVDFQAALIGGGVAGSTSSSETGSTAAAGGEH